MPGTPVQLWSPTSERAQVFHITPLGGGACRLTPVGSTDTAVTVGPVADVHIPTSVVLGRYAGTTAQQFFFVSAPGGYYRLSPASQTAVALDAGIVSGSNGVRITAFQWSGATQQLWHLELVSAGAG